MSIPRHNKHCSKHGLPWECPRPLSGVTLPPTSARQTHKQVSDPFLVPRLNRRIRRSTKQPIDISIWTWWSKRKPNVAWRRVSTPILDVTPEMHPRAFLNCCLLRLRFVFCRALCRYYKRVIRFPHSPTFPKFVRYYKKVLCYAPYFPCVRVLDVIKVGISVGHFYNIGT